MAGKLNVKNDQIVGIFQSMEYQKMAVDVSAVKGWLEKRNGIIKTVNGGVPVDVKNVIDESKLASVNLVQDGNDLSGYEYNPKWSTFSSLERSNAMRKFSSLIEQNSKLLSNIEAASRGIHPLDTKNYAVDQLKEYLQYYANWTSIHTTKKQKAYVIYLPDNCPLTVLALALGVPLAVGQSVILHSGPKISLSLALLVELSEKAGIPEGTIQLIPGNCLNILLETLSGSVNNIFINGNLYANQDIGKQSDSLIAVPIAKTSMIVFNDSDLDSACEAAISAIWDYQGMLPWSVGLLLVQEDILPTFTDKLKQKMKKLLEGSIPDCTCESPNFYNPPNQTEKLQDMIKDAKNQGVEVFQPSENKNFQPTLFIGGKVYGNNVIIEDRNNLPVGTILAFRTPKEAAALANNSRQGLAASVWCQNISLVNEIVRKLDVGTVWVNSHGVIKPHVAFTTKKNDGVGYIGGLEGLYEYIDKEGTSQNGKLEQPVVFDVASLSKAQQSWANLSIQIKIEKLLTCAHTIESANAELPNSAEWITTIRNAVQEYSQINSCIQVENFDLKVFCEPVGVIIVGSTEIIPEITIAALLLGNAVVVQRSSTKLLENLAKSLPPGLLQTTETLGLPTSLEISKYTIIGGEKSGLKQYKPTSFDLKSMVRRCTIPKNVWTDIGDSF